MNHADINARFREIRDKVESEERLTLDDGIFLYDEAVPLQAVGELANLVRERKNGNVGYYNINTHLNPTNVCVYRCRFCAFRSDLRDPKGYAMSDDQVFGSWSRGDRKWLYRDAYCWRSASSKALRVVSPYRRNLERELPTDSSEGLDRSRNQLV